MVLRVSSDHALSKFCAQTALATRYCGFLVQLVSNKERKNKTYRGEIHRTIYETFRQEGRKKLKECYFFTNKNSNFLQSTKEKIGDKRASNK